MFMFQSFVYNFIFFYIYFINYCEYLFLCVIKLALTNIIKLVSANDT